MNHRTIFYVIIFLFCYAFLQAQPKVIFTPKVCFDLAGKHKYISPASSNTSDVDGGYSIGLEIGPRINDQLRSGLGFNYMLPRLDRAKGSGEFRFMPIYFFGDVAISERSDLIVPSIIANVGYNVAFKGDLKYQRSFNLRGALYLGFGMRVAIRGLLLESIYKAYWGSASVSGASSDLDTDIRYSLLSVGLGFNL